VSIVRTLSLVFVALAIAGGCGFFSMERYYQQALPRVLDVKTGHIFPRNNHGVIVYYSSHEINVLRITFGGGAISGLLGGLLWSWCERKR